MILELEPKETPVSSLLHLVTLTDEFPIADCTVTIIVKGVPEQFPDIGVIV